ncbi:alpha/beta hydrolase [Maricaulis sp.]|uniref:alpha/beta fold hydrolase n=1 Tax=Maricaulis sp. TaxID=1486257 RepID=UPI0026171D96|nr:alpha/beta hydrolase [Maricaulis sp.]
MERIELDVGEAKLSTLIWRKPGAVRLLFAHANGFNAGTYQQMLEPLADEFEVVALDARGHGRTTLPADPARLPDWHVFARDLVAWQNALEPRRSVFAGHSMGSVCGLLAAARFGLEVEAMAFIEPVFMPTGFYAIPHIPGGAYLYQFNPMSSGARRRRRDWDSREQVTERYRGKRLFADWAPGVLEAYLDTGLKETDAGVQLSCDPAWEAAIFAAQGHDPWTALKRLPKRPAVLMAGLPGSTVYADWRLRRLGIKIDTMDEAGHLAPMSHPAQCADWLGRMLRAQTGMTQVGEEPVAE